MNKYHKEMAADFIGFLAIIGMFYVLSVLILAM